VRRFTEVTLGILTAIGGFVDIGDLVTNAQVGARLGWSLGLVVIVGVLGICVFAEMSGRVAAVSRRATFDLVRERLGPRVGLLNLLGSMAVTLLTFIAEVGGVALAVQLIVSVHYVLIVPLVAVVVWLILWKARFSTMENVLGLMGLALVVFLVALWQLDPDWGHLTDQLVTVDKPADEPWSVWAYYAVALFGAAMTPYEVFFFSSGGVEERWTEKDLTTMRLNVFIGFPLGGVLSLAIAGCTAVVFGPLDAGVDTLGQVALPVAIALGKIGLAIAILGFVAATLGAACETGLSTGYSIAQYFGWQWGKYVRPRAAARFHLVVLVAIAAAAVWAITGVDPVKVTEYSIVLSAAALPLTYFPILVIANDPGYMGDSTNGRALNTIATFYLVLLVVVSLATIPLMIITKAGQ
jgi:Mn2+/Fe2+ NRAMP family transporter